MERFVNYYDKLGVSKSASQEEIKKAYRKLAMENHPDMYQQCSAEEIERRTKIFQEISSAYDVIGDEKKRKEYDIEFAKYEARQAEERARRSQNSGQRTSSSTTSSSEQRRTSSNGPKTSSEEQRRTSSNGPKTSSEEQRRAERQNAKKTDEQSKKESGFKKFSSDIKTAWKEVREEERKTPFLKRHKTLSGKIYCNYYKDDGSTTDDIIFAFKSGSIHVISEIIYQLEKLTHITEDTVPKYIIRNRVLAYILALTMIVSGAAYSSNSRTQVTTQNGTSLSEQTPNPDYDLDLDDEYKEEQEKEQEQDSYIVVRKYTVQPNDMLSILADEANTTISSIMELNNLSSPDLIKYGETIYIPYVIEREDLKYTTAAVYYESGTDINTFAQEHDTDAASIYALNKEAFENGQVISSTLLVPTFTSQSEINEAKASKPGNTYTYSNNN